jgi:hypothetical protein
MGTGLILPLLPVSPAAVRTARPAELERLKSYIVSAKKLYLGAQDKGFSHSGQVECLASLVVALLKNLKKG